MRASPASRLSDCGGAQLLLETQRFLAPYPVRRAVAKLVVVWLVVQEYRTLRNNAKP